MNFEVNGIRYKAGKLNCFQQLTIARKLAPLLKGLTDVDLEQAQSGNLLSLGSLLDVIAGVPETDIQIVIKTCLSAVSRNSTGDKFSAMQTASGELMFDDLGLTELILVCFNTIKANMAGFTAGLPSNLTTTLSKMGKTIGQSME